MKPTIISTISILSKLFASSCFTAVMSFGNSSLTTSNRWLTMDMERNCESLLVEGVQVIVQCLQLETKLVRNDTTCLDVSLICNMWNKTLLPFHESHLPKKIINLSSYSVHFHLRK